MTGAPIWLPERPFVGRDAEFARLESVRRAAARHGRLALITGPAGIGKSRLVGEFLASLPKRQSIVTLGRSLEYIRSPFAPFIELLAADAPDAVRALTDPAATASKAASFAVVAAALAQLAERRMTILVLEDLHWADLGTLELLDYIVAGPPAPRLFLVATLRDEDVPDRAYQRILHAIERRAVVERIPLAPLDDDAIRRIASSLRVADPPAVERIVSLAAGVPYIAEELCKSAEGVRLPRSLVAAIEERFGALEQSELDALRCGAVVGERFELDLAATALGTSPLDAARALHRAQREGLIDEIADGTFRFSHALTRAAILQNMTAAQRLEWHGRLAAALVARESDPDPLRIARIAYHYAEAGDRARGHAYHRRAGETAYAVHAYADAAAFYQRAIELAGGGSEERADLLRSMADALFRSGEPERARNAYHEALALYRALNSWSDAAQTYIHLARSAFNEARPEEALAIVAEALDVIPAHIEGRRELAVVRGFYLASEGRAREALQALDELSPLEVRKQLRIAAIYHNARLYAFETLGSIAEWKAEIPHLLEAAAHAPPAEALGFFSNIAVGASFLGIADVAADYFDRTLGLARKLGLSAYEAIFCGHAAYEELLRGRRDTARALLDRAREVKADFPVLDAYRLLGELLLDPARMAESEGERIVLRALESRNAAVFGPVAGVYAERLARVSPARAAKLLHTTRAAITQPYPAWESAIAIAQHGDDDDARAIAQMFRPYLASEGTFGATAALIHAHLARRTGDLENARRWADVAWERYESVGWLNHAERSRAVAYTAPQASAGAERGPVLSPREREVAILVRKGETNRGIARALGISEKTVEKYVAALFEKLGVRSRTQLATTIARSEARDGTTMLP